MQKKKNLTVKREFRKTQKSVQLPSTWKFSLRKMACVHQEACYQMEYKSEKQRTACIRNGESHTKMLWEEKSIKK